MVFKGHEPDVVIYTIPIKELCKKGEIGKAVDFQDVMISTGMGCARKVKVRIKAIDFLDIMISKAMGEVV
jgi:pentatricopeptide repeat protein